MSKKKILFQPVLNSRGLLTFQFIIAFALVGFFMMLFAVFTLTLIVSEVVQYMTFSSGRALFLAHLDRQSQQTQAQKKYTELKTRTYPVFFQTQKGWAVIFDELQPGTGMGLNTAFENQPSSPNLFFGVWTSFQSTILMAQNPWFGSTSEEKDSFKTFIGSYLGREPTQRECESFHGQRWQHIALKHAFPGPLRPTTPPEEHYKNTHRLNPSDNGC